MLVVIGNGNVTPVAPPAPAPGAPAAPERRWGYSDEAMQAFATELFENLVRSSSIGIGGHRAEAARACRVVHGRRPGLLHEPASSRPLRSGGVFSSGIFGGIGQPLDPEARIPGILSNPQPINAALDLLYISVGNRTRASRLRRRWSARSGPPASTSLSPPSPARTNGRFGASPCTISRRGSSDR